MLLKFGLVAGVTAATVMSVDSAYALSITETGSGGQVPPSGTLGLFESSIKITDALSINSVSLTLNNFQHTWAEDIIAKLIYDQNGAAETTVSLFTQQGGGSDFNGTYTFQDGGTAFPPASVGGVLPGGTYAPETTFSTFNGINSAGTWTLSLDDVQSSDLGTLGSWTLTLSDAATPPTPIPTPAAALPGLISMGAAALRKRREGGTVEEL